MAERALNGDYRNLKSPSVLPPDVRPLLGGVAVGESVLEALEGFAHQTSKVSHSCLMRSNRASNRGLPRRWFKNGFRSATKG